MARSQCYFSQAKTCVTSVAALPSVGATARPKSKEVRNGLEGSKDCRSVGGHGNQHGRLRSGQVSLDGDDLPGSTSTFCFRNGAGVLQSKGFYPVHFEKLIRAIALMSAPGWPRTRRRFRADSRPHQTFNRHFWRG